MGLFTTKTFYFFLRSAPASATASSSREIAAICTTIVPGPVTGAGRVTWGAGLTAAALGGAAFLAVVRGADSGAAVAFAGAVEGISLGGKGATAPVCCTAL